MTKKGILSFFLTLLCSVLILGVGYEGIVKAGELLLSNEEEPKKAEFESNGSNIFYGQIEDDILLYPWNYYGQNERKMTLDELNPEMTEAVRQRLEVYVPYCTVKVWDTIHNIYEQNPQRIVENTKICDAEYLYYCFYQDRLEVRGKIYQVKLAFNESATYSFSCMEYREEDVRGTKEWEEGKKLLTEMLDKYQEEVIDIIYDMQLMYWNAYACDDIWWQNAYAVEYVGRLDILNWMLDATKEAKEAKDGTSSLEEAIYERIEETIGAEDNGAGLDSGKNKEEEEEDFQSEPEENYTCQVLELSDMIILLIQGDGILVGVFYDPVNQVFCGYNFF